MTANVVVNIYTNLDDLRIKIWIDGGCSVDALLGKQTMCHGGLDIALQQKHVQRVSNFLKNQGYKETTSETL